MATKPPSLARALDESIRAAQLEPIDRAAVALAKRYACMVDADPDALQRVGHMILPVLTALGLTPAARGKAAKGATPDAPSALDDLRARRRARSDRAAAVDATAP